MESGVGEQFQVKQASEYGNNSKYCQLLFGKKFIESFQLKPTNHIAALGCGTGELAAFVASKVPNGNVVAFDPDNERIKVAKERYGSIYNLSFHVGTISDILRNEGEFDVIYSNAVLHWIPVSQRLATFQSIFSALKPGGVTFHTIVNDHVSIWNNLIELLAEQNLMHPLSSKLNYYSHEDLKGFALKCGFEVLNLENVLEENIFPSVDVYFEWFKATMQSLLKGNIQQNALVKGIINENEDGSVTQIVGLTQLAFRKSKQNLGAVGFQV